MANRTELVERGGNGGILFLIFAVCLIVPIQLSVGSLRLSPSRMFLIVMLVPSILRLLRGYGAKFGLVDMLLLGAIIWNSISLIYNHPIQDVFQGIGMFYIEAYGAFIFGRVFVTNIERFKNAIGSLLILVVLLLPFAIAENITGTDQYLVLISKFGSTYQDVFLDPGYDRWGFDRAQGPFPHPIHFGLLFCAFIGVVGYGVVFPKRFVLRILGLGVLVLGTVSSLSSGPLTALVVQLGMGAWDLVLRSVRSRWKIAVGLFVLAYVTVDMLSNRTPFHVFASNLSFSADTAYDRIRIWEYGWVNIAKHPVFGVGLHDWERAWFMTPSIDMFWLLWGVQNGLPAFVFWLTFWIAHTAKISWSKIVDRETAALRTGYVISSLGLFVAGWTVHYWNEIFVFFMFFMGAGLWFVCPELAEDTENAGDENIADPQPQYTRFRHWN